MNILVCFAAAVKKLPSGLRALWLIVTMVLGVVFVWMMVRVYNTIDTVPTWYTGYTTLAFFLTMALTGPMLAALLPCSSPIRASSTTTASW